MATTTDLPRIYAACLASYNAGTLHGQWIDFDDVETVQDAIAKMLRCSPNPNVTVECPTCEGEGDDCVNHVCQGGKVPSAEEWAIHDHEGWHGLLQGENPDLEKLAEHSQNLWDHGPAWAAYANNVGDNCATTQGFEEAYRGEYDSEEEYAIQFVDDCYDLEKLMGDLAHYFDYAAYARDLFVNDVYSEENPEGGIFVFDRHC